MVTTLQARVRRVATGARRLVRLYGLACFVAVVCLAALAIGTFDYLVRFEDVGVRLICCALLGAVALWGFARFVVVPWRYRCSELRAAEQIERVYPGLSDRLTSAVAFAEAGAGDRDLGSRELRQAVISEAESIADEVDFDRCLDRRQPARAVMAAAISLAVIALLALIDGPSVALAAKRLLVPWGHHPWPRRHVLRWVEAPTRLALGQDFEVKLTDANGQLPDDAEIQYWFRGEDASEIERFQMQLLGNYLVHRLDNITAPFRYRAIGGDDQTMAWRELSLVEPPRITESEMILHPPAYTGQQPRLTEGNIRALVGTRITARARTTKPLSAAILETDTMGGQTAIPLTLDRDQHGFLLAGDEQVWTIVQSGYYGFRLIDQDGLDVGVSHRGEVDAIRDLPPTVSLRRPAADLMVTPSAKLSIEAIVKDDLAVRRVAVHFQQSTAGGLHQQASVELWSGPDQIEEAQADDRGQRDGGVQRTVQYVWDLTKLPAMKPGEWIDFHVTAEDYKSQVGESVRRRVTFISAEELAERIGQRQSELLSEIAEIVRLQRETANQVSGLMIQVDEVGRLGQNDVDQLQAAELNQRQVEQRLGHPTDGVAAQIRALIDQTRSNRVDSPELLARLMQFHNTVQGLTESPLPEIEHRLIDSTKIVRQAPVDDQGDQRVISGRHRGELHALFDQTGVDQKRVVEVLEELLSQLAQWDSYQQLARAIGQLKREQEEVHERTRQLRIDTLTVRPSDLSAQQRAAVKRLTQRQNDIALRFGSLIGKMESTQQNLAVDDPGAAATLTNALDLIRQGGLSGLMRDVGREMDLFRLGQAVEQQEVVIDLLQQLQDVLANRRQSQLDRKVQQLQDALAELDRVRARQQVVQQQAAGTDTPAPQQFEQWAGEEGTLAARTELLANRIERRGEDRARAALDAAGQAMRRAGAAAKGRNLSGTQQAALDAQQALDDARRQIADALNAITDALRDERIARLRQTVREFLSRQQRVIAETVQLDRDPDREVTLRGDQWDLGVRRLAGEQLALADEISDKAHELSDVAAFEVALQHVAQTMTAAGQKLSAEETGTATVQLEQLAAQQLEQVLRALMQDVPDQPADDQQSPAPDSPKDDQPAGVKYLLAQLKLIRAMQLQVNEQTRALDQAEEPWDADRVERQQELVLQQQQLAELVQRLLAATGADPARPRIVRPPSDDLDSLDRALKQDQKGG